MRLTGFTSTREKITTAKNRRRPAALGIDNMLPSHSNGGDWCSVSCVCLADKYQYGRKFKGHFVFSLYLKTVSMFPSIGINVSGFPTSWKAVFVTVRVSSPAVTKRADNQPRDHTISSQNKGHRPRPAHICRRRHERRRTQPSNSSHLRSAPSLDEPVVVNRRAREREGRPPNLILPTRLTTAPVK